jgi:3'(2'), 5'-bisphosphate nucleotidase
MLREAEHVPLLDAVVNAVRRARPDATADQVCDAIDRGNHDATAGAYWTLDPVDGTKGFLRGQQYAIALALIEEGRVSIGVMGCPNLPADQAADLTEADAQGAIYVAERGAGTVEYATASLDAVTRKVRSADGSGGAIRVCESVEKAHSSQSDTARIIEHLGAVSEPVRIDSQCKYAVVARGQADAYLRMPTKPGYVERIWDHAAGSIVATEAGAIVTDIHGRPLDFSKGAGLSANSGVICAAPQVHSRIIDAIAALGIKAPE